MRYAKVAVAAAGVLLLARAPGKVSGQALPTDPIARLGPGGAALLLLHESVQTELKFTDEQKGKVRNGLAEIVRLQREVNARTTNVPPHEKREAYKSVDEAGDKLIVDLLTPSQQARLRQIELQQLGMSTFFQQAVREALKLSDEQMQKIRILNNRHSHALGQQFRTALGRDGSGPGTVEALERMRRTLSEEYVSQAVAALDEPQKAVWKKLLGEPFELRRDSPRASERATPVKPAERGPRPLIGSIPSPTKQSGGDGMLLADADVQKALVLTDEQIEKLEVRLAEVRLLSREASAKARALPRDPDVSPIERAQKSAELLKPVKKAGDKIIKEILAPGQQVRFNQIVLQTERLSAFSHAEVQKALKLTPEQIDQIARLTTRLRMTLSRLPLHERDAPAKEYMDKAVNVLSNDQQKTWFDLIGAPYRK